MSVLASPTKLTREHDRTRFDCGQEELSEWLKRFAWQNQQANNAITYVSTIDGEVVGYYALCSGVVEPESVSEQFARRRPRPIPCIVLARLAVDRRAQGKGVGRALLADALWRAAQASETIGAACVVINCVDRHAKSFYLRFGIFHESPLEELQLMVPIKGLQQALQDLGLSEYLSTK